MEDNGNPKRRNVLRQLGVAGVAIGTFSGSAVAGSSDGVPHLLENEEKLSGSERGKYISSVRSSDHFKNVKQALIDDGYKPPAGKPTVTRGNAKTSGNEMKQMIINFENTNETEYSAVLYGLQSIESSNQTVLANIYSDGRLARQYVSGEEMAVAQSGVYSIDHEEGM